MNLKPLPYGPVIRNIAEVPWDELPGHHDGALSKLLVHPDTVGARQIDHRISTYAPKAYVAPHSHRIQEQVYHVLSGEGLMEIAGRART
jgi:quercetin dioxygenase-like cupin family protein